MSKAPITLTQAIGLINLIQVHYWMAQSMKYLSDAGMNPAPFPENLTDYVGCDFLMQELPTDEGRRIGRLIFTRNGDVRYQRDWPLVD